MLVLTRRTGEAINIGDEIEISVLSVTDETIRIAIDAPQSVAVHRGEVFQSGHYQDRVEVKRAR